MSHDLIAFSGRVSGPRKSHLSGAIVEIIGNKTKELIHTSVTDSDGYYHFSFVEKDNPALFKQLLTDKVSVRVLSSDRSLVIEKKNVSSDEDKTKIPATSVPSTN